MGHKLDIVEGGVHCRVTKHGSEYCCALSMVHKQESAFEKKSCEVQKQLWENVQPYKVLSIYYCCASLSASFDEWLFAALFSAYSIFAFLN